MKHHVTRRQFAALSLGAGLVLGAFGATVAGASTPPDSAPVGGAAAADAVVYPLTGVAVADPGSYTERPALVVKIDNGVNSRPQSGLNEADIVFEEIVEGRVTRFAAVFNSMDSDPVGNIRSGRTQDVDLLGSLNNPIFAYSGGNAGVNAALGATGWPLLTQGDGMFRVDGRGGAPYNLFANTSDLFARGIERGAGNAVPQFVYGTPTGSPVSNIDLTIGSYNVNWRWDAEQGLYFRSQQGAEHPTNTGQASTNNVIVLLVPYGQSAAAAGSPEAQTVGTGPVVVYSNGVKTEGTWSKADPTAPFVLEAHGAPIELSAGRSWVELADVNSYELTDG